MKRTQTIWKGDQWRVTPYGVEAIAGNYSIPRSRLAEQHWVEHLAEKEWVNVPDFIEALRIGRAALPAR